MAGVPLLATHPVPFIKGFFCHLHVSILNQRQFFRFPTWSIMRQFFSTKTVLWPVLCMWEFKLLNSPQKSWSSATCNDLMTSSHLIWDAIQVRCWQNTWTFIARPLNVTPVLIFHLVFPPQFPELGRVDRGAGCGIGKKWEWNRAEQRCEDISIKGQAFSPSFHKCSTAICKIQQVEFLDTKIVPV